MSKTIFIVISEGLPARNIKQTGVLRGLIDGGLRIVVFLPNKPTEEYLKDFPEVIFEIIPPVKHSIFRNRIFDQLLISCLKSDTIAVRLAYGKRKGKASLKGRLNWYLWSNVFGRYNTVKRLMRWIELNLYPERQTSNYFYKYNPDMVFSTSIQSKLEIPFLKEAKRRCVKTVLLPKSWDNYDMSLFRVLPDKIIVQNDDFKKLLAIAQDFDESNITTVGFTQFDVYHDIHNKVQPRNAFLSKLSLNPDKKVVFFGSGGIWGPHDEVIAEHLVKYIQVNNLSLIVRTHFGDRNPSRFDICRGADNVYVDDKHERNEMYGELCNHTKENMVHLASLIQHSDVIINTVSTLSLDAACLQKPIICTASGRTKKSPEANYHKTSFYKKLLNTGGVRLAYSLKDLDTMLDDYLEDPSIDRYYRGILRDTLCYKVDGQSAKRVSNYIINEITK